MEAARSDPAVKRRVRATPGAKKFRIGRVDMLSPASSLESTDFPRPFTAALHKYLLRQTTNVGNQILDFRVF